MANKNEEALRRADEAFQKGDMEPFWALFADDVVAHIGGRSKLAGDVKGKESLQDSFAKFMQALGSPEILTHDILANDTHGVVLQTFRGERGNERLTTNGVGIFHFTKGKITEAWFFDEDPYTADPFYDRGL